MLRLPPLPAPPSPPPRTPFPVIAVIAPAVGAVVISAITGSLFVLVFAALSPLIAVATALDARRTARRHRRDEAARFDRECASWEARVPELHALERARADAEHPPVGAIARASSGPPADAPLRVGTAPGASSIAAELAPPSVDGEPGVRLEGLVALARTHAELPVVVPPGRVRVVGRGRAADAVARLVAAHPGCALERAASPSLAVEPSLETELLVESPTRARLRGPDGSERAIRPEGATRRELELILARRSAGEQALPAAARWAELASEAARAGRPLDPGTIGVGLEGPLALDLLADAPHALVGGTTGSGKSEFLRTLALSWAVGAPPRERSILLVDFKGGSAFTELAALPHVVGVITDLDARGAERALRSLRAELRRRESLLLQVGARDIRETPAGTLARLLVLVDEYAALVETFPELQPIIADLAARGRSLGIHLVLCTQRPSGVVRDAVAANCGIRVAFRMSSAADATGLLPCDPPAADAPAGRAVVAAAGRVAPAQVAVISPADIAAVAARWAGAEPAQRPWVPPLASGVPVSALDALPDDDGTGAPAGQGPDRLAISFGVLDDPDRQRHLRAVWRPARDGALLVVGAPRSGTDMALALLARGASAGARTVVLPDDLPDAIGTLVELRDELDDATDPVLLVVPEIDALVAEAGDAALELLDALDPVARRLRRGGGGLVASTESVLRARSGVVGRFDSVLLLRTASLDDHRAAGGAPGDFDPDAPRGRGRWQGRAVQLADEPAPLPSPRRPSLPQWSPGTDSLVAVVSGTPARTARRLEQAGCAVSLEPAALDRREPGVAPRARARVVVADAETWQASWTTLAGVRREGVIVIADASPSDARLVLGPRSDLPLRGRSVDEIILVEAGEPPCRARWSALGTSGAPRLRRSG